MVIMTELVEVLFLKSSPGSQYNEEGDIALSRPGAIISIFSIE